MRQVSMLAIMVVLLFLFYSILDGADWEESTIPAGQFNDYPDDLY